LDDVLKNRKSKSKQVLSFNDEFADYILFLLLLCQARQIQSFQLAGESICCNRPANQTKTQKHVFIH
jgi:hypothetical protein